MAWLSSLLYTPFFALFAIFITYTILKLQKGSAGKARKFLYKTNENGEEEPLVIGHRAGQFEAAENTLIAIRTAHRNGATAVELDLDFTEDQYGVIIHDETVDRTTDGYGAVNKHKLHELKKLDATFKAKTLRYAGGKIAEASSEQIPTLREAVELCLELDMKIILDVKSNAQLTANLLSELLKEFPEMTKFVMVTSFYPTIVYAVKRRCPDFLTALIWRHDYTSLRIDHQPRFTGLSYVLMQVVDVIGDLAVHSWLPHFLGISAVSMHKEHISPRYVQQWNAKEIEIMAWTVNNPLEKEYFLKKLKIPIITDSTLNSENCPEQAF